MAHLVLSWKKKNNRSRRFARLGDGGDGDGGGGDGGDGAPAPAKQRASCFRALMQRLSRAMRSRRCGDEASAMIRSAIERLVARIAALEKQRDERSFHVVTCVKAGEMSEARTHLLLKKRYQGQIVRCNTHRYNLETQLVAIEESASNREVVQMLHNVHAAMKKINSPVDLDALDDTTEGLRDMGQDVREVSAVLDEQVVFDLFDTSDCADTLDQELQALQLELGGGGGGGVGAPGAAAAAAAVVANKKPPDPPPREEEAVSLVESLPVAPEGPLPHRRQQQRQQQQQQQRRWGGAPSSSLARMRRAPDAEAENDDEDDDGDTRLI
jgi:hypothetical protein